MFQSKGVAFIIQRALREENGDGIFEYGLIIVLVAVILIGTLVALNGGFKSIQQKIGVSSPPVENIR